MYLIDTNVISEARKGRRTNRGVKTFFNNVRRAESSVYLSSISVGELRRGVELIRYRGDHRQARRLDSWLQRLLNEYADNILGFDADVAQLWGWLRVPHHQNALDKQIAATALIHDLTVVTRNTDDFSGTGVRLLDPFS